MTVFDPTARLVPFTVKVALPEARVEVPSVVAPTANVTDPVGSADPEAGLMVAVRMVDAVCARVAGLAEMTVVVAMAGTVTTTIAEPDDPLNDTLPA